jgi:hypothetical protein
MLLLLQMLENVKTRADDTLRKGKVCKVGKKISFREN